MHGLSLQLKLFGNTTNSQWLAFFKLLTCPRCNMFKIMQEGSSCAEWQDMYAFHRWAFITFGSPPLLSYLSLSICSAFVTPINNAVHIRRLCMKHSQALPNQTRRFRILKNIIIRLPWEAFLLSKVPKIWSSCSYRKQCNSFMVLVVVLHILITYQTFLGIKRTLF